jgi:ATP-dependent Lon protease
VAGPPKIDLTPGHPTIRIQISPTIGFVGPSAGTAFLVAMAALVTGCKINKDAAVRGEPCLDGRLTAVGCIAGKAQAVMRLNVRQLYVPSENATIDMSGFKKAATLVGCDHVNRVLHALLKNTSRASGEARPAPCFRRAFIDNL